jgi:hypothetical protein
MIALAVFHDFRMSVQAGVSKHVLELADYVEA